MTIETHVFNGVTYRPYNDENDLEAIKHLFSAELSEPYQIWTYRYFSQRYPSLTIIAEMDGDLIGCCMGMMQPGETHPRESVKCQAYIGMISVTGKFKGRRIGTHLFDLVLPEMVSLGATVVCLETEIDNRAAIAFYEGLGFRKTRLFNNFYLNGKSAYRMKRWLVRNIEQVGHLLLEGASTV